MITVIVQSERFVVYKSLLAFFSEFFDAALFGNFIEAEKAEMDLKEVRIDAFKAYIGRLYTGYVESKSPKRITN